LIGRVVHELRKIFAEREGNTAELENKSEQVKTSQKLSRETEWGTEECG